MRQTDEAVPESPSTLPRGRPETSRTADALVRRARACGCGQQPSVRLLRAFSRQSRLRADALRAELESEGRDVAVVIEPGAVSTDLATSSKHVCFTWSLGATDARSATLGFRWEPNQPERGSLLVRTCDLDAVLDPGTGLEVYPTHAGLAVENISDHRNTRRLLTITDAPVDVEDGEFTHLLFKDEHFVGMAPQGERFVLENGAVVRHALDGKS